MVEAEAPILTTPPINKEFSKWASLLGGSVAGAASKTCTAPLSRMTILMQIQGARPASETHLSTTRSGVFQALRDVAKAEGVRSLWRGNLTSVLHKFPSGGINYFVYESSKIFMRPFWRSETDPGIRTRFCCGFLGGTAASAITYPLDIVRTRLAANTAVGRPNASLRTTFDSLIAEGGVRALFRGVGVTLLCQGTNIALNFAMYETLQIRAIAAERRLWESFGWTTPTKKQRGSFLTSLVCGACAGVTASTIIFPLDLVRRRQQVMKRKQSGISVIRDVIRNEGFRGLYQGIGPELLKVVPGVAINFYVYELVRQELLGANIAPR